MALLLGLFFAAVGTVTVGIFLAKVWWLPELISVHGAAIDDQMVMTLIIAGTVFFLAQITLGYFIWKFRGQGGKASNWHENPKLEFTWTAITLVIFLSLGISGNRIWAQYFQTPVPKDAVMVEITAQQFAWNIRYPGADGVMGRTNPALIDDAAGNYIGLDPKDPAGKDDVITQNLMAIPVNRPIRLMLRSKDVTHSFFVPQLRVKQDVQGVGGYITPPREYFQIVEKIVRNHGGIFISDEVQTGWGRTGGKWFGIEHWGVVPDIITGAKGLANGSPIGLTVAKHQVADGLKGVTLSTFGGNPVTATAAKAVIDFIEEQNLLDNCTETGGYLRGSLEELKDKHEIVGDVRGMGLMQAIELVEDRKTKKPAAAQTVQLLEATREHGLLVGKGGLYGNVIRVTPPMNIGRSDVDQFIQLLDKSLTAVAAADVGGVR